MNASAARPQAPQGGQKVMMKMPPNMMAPNNNNGNKKMMMMPPGAMPQPVPAGMMAGGKKIMMAPPSASQMMGKSMVSNISSAPGGMMMRPGSAGPAPAGMKKMMAMPPSAGTIKVIQAGPPSAGGPSLGQSMVSNRTGAQPQPAPAFAMMNGKKVMMPPGAKMMSAPGPAMFKAPMMANNNINSRVPGPGPAGGNMMPRPAGMSPSPSPSPQPSVMRTASPPMAQAGTARTPPPQPQMQQRPPQPQPAALSASESRTAVPHASPNKTAAAAAAGSPKKKRNSLFSFLRVGGSSSDEDEDAPAARRMTQPPLPASGAVPPGASRSSATNSPMRQPSPVKMPVGTGAAMATAPSLIPGKKMVKMMVGPPGTGSAAMGPTAPAGMTMKKMLVGPPPAGTTVVAGAGRSPSLAASGINMIGMPGTSARTGPTGSPAPEAPDLDTVSDVLLHSNNTLERMAAAAAAESAPAPSRPASATPQAPPLSASTAAVRAAGASGLCVASSTTLGGDAASALQSAGIASSGDKSAKAKAPIKRVSGRFAAFAVADSDDDSSAEDDDNNNNNDDDAGAGAAPTEPSRAPPADEEAGAQSLGSPGQMPSRSQTPAERADTAFMDSDGEGEAGRSASGGGGGGSPDEDHAPLPSGLAASLARSTSTKLGASTAADSTQPPHTRDGSHEGSHAAVKTTKPAAARKPVAAPSSSAKKKMPATSAAAATTSATPLRSRATPATARPASSSPARPKPTAPARSASSAAKKPARTKPTTAAATATAPAKKKAAVRRQPSSSTLGGGSEADEATEEADADGQSADGTAATALDGDAVTVSDEEDDDAVEGGNEADARIHDDDDDSSEPHTRAKTKKNGQPRRAASTKKKKRAHRQGDGEDDDDDDDEAEEDFFDGGVEQALSGRDIYRLVHLLRKEEEAAAHEPNRASSGRRPSRTRSRTRRKGGKDRADAWDRLGRHAPDDDGDNTSADYARLREPYAVHLHSTREIIGSPGIPWRYTDRHTSTEPFPPAPRVARPLGVINVGGGRYSTLRTRGTSSPYALATATSRPRSQSVDGLYGHADGVSGRGAAAPRAASSSPHRGGGGGGGGIDARDLYTSSILEDLSHSAIRAYQQQALRRPHDLTHTSLGSLDEAHPYCASPPRPLLAAVPVSPGASPLRSLARGDATDLTQASAPLSAPPGPRDHSFFDAHRQMYFGTGTGTSPATTPLRTTAGPGAGGLGSRLRERLLVSPLREEPSSSHEDLVPPPLPQLGASLSYRESPLLLRPASSSARASSAGLRGSALPVENARTTAMEASQRRPNGGTRGEPPALIPATLRRPTAAATHAEKAASATTTAATTTTPRTSTQPAAKKRPQSTVRLTSETIERLTTPSRRSASAPRSFQDFARQAQRRAGSGAGTTRCGKWVDEVLSAMSEKPTDGEEAAHGGSASVRTPVQIPLVDMRTAFRPVVLHEKDDDATRRRKLDTVLASDPVSEGFIGSRPRPHVAGFSFKSMTGIRSPVPSASMMTGESPHRSTRSHHHHHHNNNNNDSSSVGGIRASPVPVVAIPNMPPSEGLPFEMYSTVKVKNPQRPSAWALTPERDADSGGVLPGQAALRRVVRSSSAAAVRHAGDDDDDDDEGQDAGAYDTVEEVHQDEFKRPYIVIKRIPRGAAAERQMQTSKRLSLPKKRFVRTEED